MLRPLNSSNCLTTRNCCRCLRTKSFLNLNWTSLTNCLNPNWTNWMNWTNRIR